MTNPAVDFPMDQDQTQWLIEALSLPSTEPALNHLCRGWLHFTPAVAVLVCQYAFDETRGSFLREGESPRYFPKLATGHLALDSHLKDLLPELPVEDLTLSPVASLEWDHRQVGWLVLWLMKEENAAPECAWLNEASARVLANRQRIDDQLQADKLDALAEFAAGAGHEINNPVATISGRIQGLLQKETDLERRRQLLTIGGQALRIRDMIGDTMLFARPPTPEPERLDLQQVLPEILAPLEDQLKLANFRSEIPEPVALFADRAQLGVVLTELLRNSVDWLDDGGHVHLMATSIEMPDGPMAQIVIEDDGESFREEDVPHLFDPFFCGRQAGRGLGFGLPKCWRIVSNHHGRIGIASLPDQGTRVTILWPAYEPNKSE